MWYFPVWAYCLGDIRKSFKVEKSCYKLWSKQKIDDSSILDIGCELACSGGLYSGITFKREISFAFA